MADEKSRSERVVEAYKRHKLARSARRRIHDLIRDFDSARVADRRRAGNGLVLLLLAIVPAWVHYATVARATLY